MKTYQRVIVGAFTWMLMPQFLRAFGDYPVTVDLAVFCTVFLPIGIIFAALTLGKD